MLVTFGKLVVLRRASVAHRRQCLLPEEIGSGEGTTRERIVTNVSDFSHAQFLKMVAEVRVPHDIW